MRVTGQYRPCGGCDFPAMIILGGGQPPVPPGGVSVAEEGGTVWISPHSATCAERARRDRTPETQESRACQNIAGGAWGHMTSRVWAVAWTRTGPKERRTRYVHDVEDHMTGERTATLYPDADEYAVKTIHFALTDSWRAQ